MWYFLIFVSNSRSKQNSKNPEHTFGDIDKWKKCAKVQRKILNFMVVRAHQRFSFSRQNKWFPKTLRALSKFLYGILHYLISNIKI